MSVEIRSEFLDKDNCSPVGQNFSWLETNLNNKEQGDNEQETSEMQFEDCALKSNARAFASRSKAKAKPQRRISASLSTKTVPIEERIWTDIAPGKIIRPPIIQCRRN